MKTRRLLSSGFDEEVVYDAGGGLLGLGESHAGRQQYYSAYKILVFPWWMLLVLSFHPKLSAYFCTLCYKSLDHPCNHKDSIATFRKLVEKILNIGRIQFNSYEINPYLWHGYLNPRNGELRMITCTCRYLCLGSASCYTSYTI
jgi:hypothetical protein